MSKAGVIGRKLIVSKLLFFFHSLSMRFLERRSFNFDNFGIVILQKGWINIFHFRVVLNDFIVVLILLLDLVADRGFVTLTATEHLNCI